MSPIDKLLAVAVVACWSANLVLVKLGVAEIPPLLMSLLRFILVAALLVPFRRISRRHLPWIMLVSITFGAMHFGLLFIALGLTEAGTSAVLVQLGAPMASLLACLVFREPLGVVRAAGLAMTVGGVVVLALGPTFPGPLALGLLIASAVGWAVTNLVVKMMPPLDAMALTGWSALFTIPQLAIATLLFEDHSWTSLAGVGWHGWGAVIYSALVSSIMAYGIWYRLLARNSVNAVVPYSMLNPVFAIGLGAVVFGETVPLLKLAGTLLILAGVVLVLLPRGVVARTG
ncbi:DMT family transporter [Ancylobacter defluvii]|uniref:Membrane protein n=1 Tax=Ancylobacter defluvii TaxID=1282440 RepID=A0A9W6JXS6_9HYPH|nr:EamA family transporter [Ancylobacter defluvii]MBS7586543.1 EamA family transporter [Ancylobacter defluvii]GLK85831.1 membrane protein [Ancylobacter defluvii]